MQDLVEWTGKVFPDFEKAEIAELAGFLEILNLTAGEILFTAGEPADSMFFLLEGRLAVSRETGFNGKSQVIALLRPFAPVGEGNLAGSDTRTATVKTVENSSVLRLKKESFNKFAEKEPAAACRLLKLLLFKTSKRLEKCSERLVHVL